MTITPTNAALVLVEFQNQWTLPDFYHALIGREMQRLRVMENAQAVTSAARKAGMPVIHAPLVVDPQKKRGLFAHLTQGMVFRAGTSAAEIDARVFDRHDLIAKGRTAFDAFVDSDLETLMRSTGRSVFLFGGFATDQCVVRTIRTALRKELDAWLIRRLRSHLRVVSSSLRIASTSRTHCQDGRDSCAGRSGDPTRASRRSRYVGAPRRLRSPLKRHVRATKSARGVRWVASRAAPGFGRSS